MPTTSRPTTPAATSDTSSDPDSLSDLDSGWTDLSSNRSGGRHSPSTISDADEAEEARSAIDRYEVEAWEGLTPEGNDSAEFNVDEDTLIVESGPPADTVHSPSPQQGISDLTLEDWVADALESSLLSDDDSSTPHMSMHGSRATLRLAFPDPLSNSGDNILPSHVLSRCQSRSTEADSETGGDHSTHAHTLSSIPTESFTGSLPTDLSLSVPEDDEADHDKTEHYDSSFIELIPSFDAPYALSIILLGHPPLPHLKDRTLSGLMDIVASVFNGAPRNQKGTSLTRIYEVFIDALQEETNNTEPNVDLEHRIVVSDRTSGSSLSSSSSSSTLDRPTVALVFIQPPLSSPSLPPLPFNTRYLPLLLPSVSDNFASSLLDLSPSVLFDHSVPDISNPDHASRKLFALQQCLEINIANKRLDGMHDVLTIDEFIALPTQRLSLALKDLIFPPKDMLKEVSKQEAVRETIDMQSGISAFRKQVVLISAFIVALLFGGTVFFRGTRSTATYPTPPIPTPQVDKVWSFLHPFVNRSPSVPPTSSIPSPASTELPTRSTALIPASLRSFAVSVFLPELTFPNAAEPSRTHRSCIHHDTPIEGRRSVTRATRYVRTASIDSATRPLTLDAPCSKSLSTFPAVYPPSIRKGKEKATDALSTVSSLPLPSSSTSLSTRISNALSPLFIALDHDLRELNEAIDALLRALLQLTEEYSQGIGVLVQVLSKQAEDSIQSLAGKVFGAAQTVSDRHSRARNNARKVRDVGERYVSAAKHKLGVGLERARENAKEVMSEVGSKVSARRLRREQSRKLQRQPREQQEQREPESAGCLFHGVWALVM